VATGEVWHSDMSCEPEPPMGSILYLHQTPPVGGDTAFANMYLAYESLSEPIRRLVEGLSAFHASAHVYSRGAYERSDKKFPEAVHPIVRRHPVTGRKCLFVNRGFTKRIEGLKSTRATRCWICCCATPRRRNSSAASAGTGTPSPSGTIAARCTAPRSTITRTCGTAIASPSRVTGRFDRRMP